MMFAVFENRQQLWRYLDGEKKILETFLCDRTLNKMVEWKIFRRRPYKLRQDMGVTILKIENGHDSRETWSLR